LKLFDNELYFVCTDVSSRVHNQCIVKAWIAWKGLESGFELLTVSHFPTGNPLEL